LEGFEGVVNEFDGTASVDFAQNNLELKGLINLPVMAMSTGITLRDVHMRSKDWLNEDRYSHIRFELEEGWKQRVKKKGRDKWFVLAQGRFTLKGRSKDIEIPLTFERKKTEKGETLYIKGSFVVTLAEYGIRGPTAMKMIGAKVSPYIKVTIKLVGHDIAGFGPTDKNYSW